MIEEEVIESTSCLSAEDAGHDTVMLPPFAGARVPLPTEMAQAFTEKRRGFGQMRSFH